MSRTMLTGNAAAAWGARLAEVDYVPAFPITPQNEIVETLARWSADAEYVIVMTNSFASIGKAAVKRLRERGKKIGLARLRLIRPFPHGEIQRALRRRKAVAVIDQNISWARAAFSLARSPARFTASPIARPCCSRLSAGWAGGDFDPASSTPFLTSWKAPRRRTSWRQSRIFCLPPTNAGRWSGFSRSRRGQRNEGAPAGVQDP